MSSELGDLYQDLILDHNRRPRNFGRLVPHSHQARGVNPLCGDEIVLELAVSGGVIQDLRFEGKGCAISRASASMMTEAVKGKPAKEAEALALRFRELVTKDDPGVDVDELGKLAAFEGVREYPARVKCATLAWHALEAALETNDEEAVVSTE